MGWSKYEVFSVVSGLLLLGMALLDQKASLKERLQYLAGGVGFTWYGWYVAHQTSGTFEFPIVVFLLPVFLIGRGIFALYENAQPAAGPETATATPSSPAAPVPAAAPSLVKPAIPAQRSRRCVSTGCAQLNVSTDEGTCTSCGSSTQLAGSRGGAA